MININLIPPALRNDGKGAGNGLTINIPPDLVLGVGMGLILLFLAIHLILGVFWLAGLGRLAGCKVQWQQLSGDKAILDSINNESKDLKDKLNLLGGMTTQQALVWSPKFNAISDALSKGLWLRSMVLDKNGLSIEGSVVSKTRNEIANMDLFLSALKQNHDFMKDFSSLEVSSIQRAKNDTVEVTDFTLVAKLKNEQNH